MPGRLYKRQINETLKHISGISPIERQRLVNDLGKDAVDGLSQFELEKHLKNLKFGGQHDFGNAAYLDRSEIQKAKQSLLDKMKKKG